jgi:membrane protease YdiL (CAAX protease family)
MSRAIAISYAASGSQGKRVACMQALAWFLGLCILALLAIAAFTYPAWLLLHPHFSFPFHRIGERIGMLALLVGFVLVARHLGLADRVSLGYGLPRRQFVREMLIGLALGIATMAAVVGIMAALGVLGLRAQLALTGGAVALLVLKSAGSALAVAFIEETFLRGAMQSAITRESGTWTAVLCTAALFSATHFFASFHIAPQDVTPHSGVSLLLGTLHVFATPLAILDAFLALFAVGVVLALVRSATGNIAACIGLHAGWVWVMLVAHGLSQPQEGSPLRFLLSRFDGFIGWLVFAWTLLLTVPLWRFYLARSRASRGAAVS